MVASVQNNEGPSLAHFIDVILNYTFYADCQYRPVYSQAYCHGWPATGGSRNMKSETTLLLCQGTTGVGVFGQQ